MNPVNVTAPGVGFDGRDQPHRSVVNVTAPGPEFRPPPDESVQLVDRAPEAAQTEAQADETASTEQTSEAQTEAQAADQPAQDQPAKAKRTK